MGRGDSPRFPWDGGTVPDYCWMVRDEYRIRRDERQSWLDALNRRHGRLADLRLATIGLGAVVAWLVFGRFGANPIWLALPLIAFAALAIVHEGVLVRRDRARRAVAFYDRGLARLEDRWIGTGPEGAAFAPADHLYAADLDLFGRGSIFQLISTARLGAGEQALANWLLTPAAPDEIRARQAAITELRPRMDLRERIALAGEEAHGWFDTPQLAQWGASPPALTARWPPFAAAALALANVTTLGGAFFAGWSSSWFGLSALASLLLTGAWHRRTAAVLATANAPAHQLQVLASILSIVEREEVSAPRLVGIQRRLATAGEPASRRIRELGRLIQMLESRGNQFFAPVAALLLLGTQLAWAIEGWRRRNGPALSGWTAAIGEFEALLSLSGYAAEHADDPFPTIVTEGPLFDGEDLAHPLIPASRAIPNSIRLDDDTRVLVVSGSNMSGKSTLLRTVGLAAVLGQAGAPIRGRRLRLSPLAVGATLRIQDSLQEGRSRFFAEITRLRAIVDRTADPMPVLFLLDELLAGTNSHDRRVGAASIVSGLVKRDAIGLVTTHDLALAELADTLEAGARNVHFSDTFSEGEIRFDYRMRPGVVETSNALELMRAIGLLEHEEHKGHEEHKEHEAYKVTSAASERPNPPSGR